MTDPGVAEALDQVRRMQTAVRDRLRFRGFSSTARIAGGFVALAGAAALARLGPPERPLLHLAGWGAVLLVAGGLALRDRTDREIDDDHPCE
jgi:4-hydroxybenzoate polyprenyltransferase